MPFTADLNPKGSKSMDLGDLLKMNETMARKKLYENALADKSGKTVIIPVNLKSSADDEGVPFKFGNNYQSED
jgi:uncharacterized protein YihD (DUF1040 family)